MFALLAILGVLHATPGPQRDGVVTAFLDSLAGASTDPLLPIASPDALALRDWQLLRADLETYSCVTIHRSVVTEALRTENEVSYVITVDATGIARGAGHRPLRVPSRWHVDAVRNADGWRFRRALLGYRVTARQYMKERDWTQEQIEVVGGAELEGLLKTMADELSDHAERFIPQIETLRAIARRRGLAHADVFTTRMLSVAALAWGKSQQARDYAEEAYELAEQTGDADDLATVGLTLGTTRWVAGANDAADAYRWSASLMDVADDPRASMKAMYMHGLLLISHGAVRGAVASFNDLAAAAERFDWTEGRSIAATQLFAAYEAVRETAGARGAARDALHYAERLHNERMISIARYNLAMAEYASGDREAASALMTMLAASKTATPAAAGAARHQLAEMLLQSGKIAEADAELTRALEVSRTSQDVRLIASVLDSIARLNLQAGRPEEALRVADEAEAVLRSKPSAVGMMGIDPTWSVLATRGRALRRTGRVADALLALQMSVERVEARRAEIEADELTLASFMQDKATPYRELASLLIEQGRVPEALIIAERLRARALGTSVARGGVERLPPMSAADKKRYDALNAAIAELNLKLLAHRDDSLRRTLQEQRLELRAFLFTLYAQRPELSARRAEDPQIVLDDPHRLLPDRAEALLTFTVHDDETFAFFIERHGEQLDVTVRRVRVRRDALERQVDELVSAIGRRSLDYRRGARALYDLLVAGFEPRRRAKKLLTIVPDGVLWRLPFQTLLRPDGEPLVTRVAIAYAPSLALLRAERHEPHASPDLRLLAVADPSVPHATQTAARTLAGAARLTPLPDARREVREIAALYDNRSRVLIGADASEAAVKRQLGDARILHLATHGLIDDASPMHSAVVLNATGADDGLLEAREILELGLSADLAILSTCESARGGLSPGEGMIGLSWALMVAGCRNTMVSHWKVASRSTADLMIAFHRALKRPGATYASALREAQLAMLRTNEFRHPFYWSPFVLITTSQ
ncbi:MAG TPA: CHAT domain-containing tetratricopeptide repeat protein [Thermoanaerobaculia bacterium]|nr:CHAT domain-containing tetratricopeptide repeat protein [Thermoanaerobaculia bacterium]